MNAPFTPPAQLAYTARAILCGNWSVLPEVEHELYTTAEWQDAASYALEAEDYADFDMMLARHELHDEFIDWQNAAYLTREYVDFDTWLADSLFPSPLKVRAMGRVLA